MKKEKKNKNRKDEKHNSEEVLPGWNAPCAISSFTRNIFTYRHSFIVLR